MTYIGGNLTVINVLLRLVIDFYPFIYYLFILLASNNYNHKVPSPGLHLACLPFCLAFFLKWDVHSHVYCYCMMYIKHKELNL